MKMLRKIIDCKSLEISQENCYGGVFPVTIQAYCVQTATLLSHHRFVLEYVPKPSCLKKNVLRKRSMVDQRLSKVATP